MSIPVESLSQTIKGFKADSNLRDDGPFSSEMLSTMSSFLSWKIWDMMPAGAFWNWSDVSVASYSHLSSFFTRYWLTYTVQLPSNFVMCVYAWLVSSSPCVCIFLLFVKLIMSILFLFFFLSMFTCMLCLITFHCDMIHSLLFMNLNMHFRECIDEHTFGQFKWNKWLPVSMPS